MRFDFFEYFWEKFGTKLQSFGIDEEQAKSFYNFNFSTFVVDSELTTDDKTIFKDQTSGDLYLCYSTDEAVAIEPMAVGMGTKYASFRKNSIGFVNTSNDELRIEDYSTDIGSLNVSIYDSDAFDYATKDGIHAEQEDVAHTTKKALENVHLLPDIDVRLSIEPQFGFADSSKRYACRIETLEGKSDTYTDLEHYNNRLPYVKLVNEANNVISRTRKPQSKK